MPLVSPIKGLLLPFRYHASRLYFARRHEKDFEGLLAQAIQHEVDHLNGILFVDMVYIVL